jgi:hypothetical protein
MTPTSQEHHMTTSEPDPRTDLAGYLGLTEEQARICRQSAEDGYTGIRGKVGARLIEQDQARADEPDDGLIAVTVRLTPEQVRATAAIHPNSFNGRDDHGQSVCALNAACRAVDLPAPKPPWTSPLPNLPDLTEQQCRDAYDAGIDPYCYDPWAQIGRALKAAGWTPVEEADRG